MHRDSQTVAEAVGPHFDLDMMMQARDRTWCAIREIASRVGPGMAEEEAMELARRVLKDAGMLRGWHPIQVRFGRNTLKSFGEPSESGVVLGAHDIFFLDIGPVWQHWEGDGGDTFVVGDDRDMQRIARDVHEVFDRVAARWRTDGATGEALFQFASEQAASLGWELNLEMSGHRLGDFPHKALYKGSMAEAGFKLSPALWVLEIQIRHPEFPYSAFYEDLLLDPGRDSNS